MNNLFTSALLIFALIIPITTYAYDFEVNGIYYNINGNEATVTYNDGEYNNSDYYSGHVTIPSYVTYNGKSYRVTAIGNSAFSYCIDLIHLTIPNSVISIDDMAFFQCSNLNNVTIPNSVTYIGQMAFVLCEKLTDINLPNSLTAIKFGTFTACTELTEVTIPSSVTSIEDYAFADCINLTSTIIPKSVTTLGEEIFRSCYSLVSLAVENGNAVYDSRDNCNAIIKTSSNTLIIGCSNTIIPNSVTAIGPSAFNGLTELMSISIPNSVTEIGWGAFSGCDNLKDMYSYISDPSSISMGNNCFSFSDCTLHVPLGLSGAYQADSRWSDCFSNIVEMEIGVPVTSIELDIVEIELIEGETVQLRATVMPNNAYNKTVTWTSSDESVATVDGNGFVTAAAAGSATITAMTNDGTELSASCTITVKPHTPTMNGDVNGDGKINIIDVTDLINLVMTMKH